MEAISMQEEKQKRTSPLKHLAEMLEHEERTRPYPMKIDAALPQMKPNAYFARQPIEELLQNWKTQIASEHLADVRIASLHSLTLDSRDGAICRGQGGLCYTPHAWTQLLSLMKLQGQPSGTPTVTKWETPITRAAFWAFDVPAKSKRPRDGKKAEAVLRLFQARHEGKPYPAIRAVVSGIHGLQDTDDSRVLEVISSLEERPVEGRIYRGWDRTDGSFILDAGAEDVALAFAFSNSETGCGSIEFQGSLAIRCLDAEVTLPNGQRYQQMVQIGSSRSQRTTRRHTLPRFQAGRLLTAEERTAIAHERIATDIDKALDASRVMAEHWEAAKQRTIPMALELCAIARAAPEDDAPRMILRDLLSENGLEALNEHVDALVEIIANNERLRSLPAGSAAHFAGALALLAQAGDRTWQQARELQELAGKMVMDGWN